jgi:hypothetical protein
MDKRTVLLIAAAAVLVLVLVLVYVTRQKKTKEGAHSIYSNPCQGAKANSKSCQDWQKATFNKNIASLVNERPTISPKELQRMHQLAMQKEGMRQYNLYASASPPDYQKRRNQLPIKEGVYYTYDDACSGSNANSKMCQDASVTSGSRRGRSDRY